MSQQTKSFQLFVSEHRGYFNTALEAYVHSYTTTSQLNEAMLYSIQHGGKRIRPMLFFALLESYGYDFSEYLNIGIALECIHTYSLIHDDLPAMDNDDLRRGVPTNHKVFGEALAILAGDALLTESFSAITSCTSITSEQKVQMIEAIVKASGAKGMIDGQAYDMSTEKERDRTLEQIQVMHQKKTGELLALPFRLFSILHTLDMKEAKTLQKLSEYIGIAFQLRDDILDVIGTTEELGKPQYSDERNNKQTYVSLVGLETAQEHLEHISQTIRYEVQKFPKLALYMDDLCQYLQQRTS